MIASHPGVFRVSRRVWVLAGCVLAVALLLALLVVDVRRAGSGLSAAASTRPQAVDGRVFINGGPLVPARLETRYGRPVDHAQLVVKGSTTAGQRLTRQLAADGSGRFTLDLPPGHYTVFALIFGGSYLANGLASQPHTTVTVARDHRPPVVRIIANVF